MAKDMATLFKWLDDHIGEVRLRARPDPEGDPAFCFAQFQVVDDEAGLLCTIDIQLCAHSGYDDFDLRPFSGNEINIGFINAGVFFPEPEPRIIGMRTILCCMIATQL